MKRRYGHGIERLELGSRRGAAAVRGSALLPGRRRAIGARRWAQIWAVIQVATLLTCVACGKSGDPPAPGPNQRANSKRQIPVAASNPTFPSAGHLPSAPTAEEWTAAHSERVETVCAACHALPPPNSLTRERWELVIPSMAVMPGPSGVPQPTPEDLAWALAYYTRRAPETLGAVATYPPDSPLEFNIEHFTPPGLEREKIPAVANVTFARLERADRAELLISEMRTSVLMLHIPWAPEPVRSKIRPLVPKLDYPVHTEFFDVNGDGLGDLITAGIGGMNPSDDVRGRVSIAYQGEGRTYTRHTVLADVPRACDAQPADLDGDGDTDLLVSAFGWRGPGEVLWLENIDPSQTPAVFVKHVIDDRDGAIHLAPHDFDGDGDIDFAAVISQEHEQIVLYVNDGHAQFRPKIIFRAPHPAWGFSGLELVDFDGDGDQDLLMVNGDTLDDDLLKPYHGVRWLENLGQLRFASRAILSLAGCESATATDLDSDGDMDVVAVAFLPQISPEVWRTRQLDSVVWAENVGRDAGGFQWQVHSLEKERCYHPTVAAADYNGDGRIDIAVGNYVWIPTDGKASVRADYVTLFTGR